MSRVPISLQARTTCPVWDAEYWLSGSAVPELADHLVLMKVYCSVGPYHFFLMMYHQKESPLLLSFLTFLNLRILGGRYRGRKFLFAIKLHTFCQRILSLTVQAQWIIPCKLPLQFLISTFWLSRLKIFNASCRKQASVNKADTTSGDQRCKKGTPLCHLLSYVTLRGE